MALDAGTTRNRCIIFDGSGNIRASVQREFRQYYPKPGWVEHNADEIWETQLAVMQQALASAPSTRATPRGAGTGRACPLAASAAAA